MEKYSEVRTGLEGKTDEGGGGRGRKKEVSEEVKLLVERKIKEDPKFIA